MPTIQRHPARTRPSSSALRFVLTLGFVNLFADITYEGGGALNGPFLGTLGASAAAMATLVVARVGYPLPSTLERGGELTARAKGFTAPYWLYMGAGALFAAGLTSFELISFHLSA